MQANRPAKRDFVNLDFVLTLDFVNLNFVLTLDFVNLDFVLTFDITEIKPHDANQRIHVIHRPEEAVDIQSEWIFMSWCNYPRNETLVHQQPSLHQLHRLPSTNIKFDIWPQK